MKEELALALIDFRRCHGELADRFSQHVGALEKHHRAIDSRFEGQDGLVATVDQHLRNAIQEQGSSFHARVDEVHALAAAVKAEVDIRFRQTMRQVWWSLGIGVCAFFLGVGSLISISY